MFFPAFLQDRGKVRTAIDISRNRYVLDRSGRRQRAQEIAEIVGQRMKLKPNRVGSERPAR
jgi:hypothetical protein